MLGGEKLQRVLHIGRAAADCQALLGAILIDPTLGDQFAQQIIEVQEAILGGCSKGGHAGSSVTLGVRQE
ncbi:hypothetical protein FQZ97_1162630 [compost metagenome]